MRILHTSDWHIGRRLGRHDRTDEFRAVLSELTQIARSNEVDLVLVSGDVFDRPFPPVEALSLGLGALRDLAEVAPVVAVAGNHDSPELFDALAPLLRTQGKGVHLLGAIRRPEDGAMFTPDVLGVGAVVAGFPFLREGRVVDFMRDTGEWYGAYATKVGAITAVLNRAIVDAAGADAVPILMAHFMVGGVKVGGSERELHIGEAYAATAQAIPPGPAYVALGHIHAPQRVPGSPVPAEYAGSLLALDFGVAGDTKRVVLVDAAPGRLAVATSVPLVSGRSLVRATGTWDELEARVEELREHYLDLTIPVGGADPELGRLASDTFPYLVNVRVRRPDGDGSPRRQGVGPRPDEELYAAFVERETGQPPTPAAIALFRQILEEAHDAAP